MRRFALLVLAGVAISGCTVHVQGGAGASAAPEPPAPPSQPAPPAPPDQPAPPAPPVVAGPEQPAPPNPPGTDAQVEEAPEVTTADPEEVTATTEPPDPVYEEETDMPGAGFYWVHGYWGWTGADWAWYSGRWLRAPEGRVYVEPYYERVGANVVFVRGYWGPPNPPHRSYGGERLVFARPPRPVDYRRGAPPHFERRAGDPPGHRPATFYARATGPSRPLPHATAPSYRVAARGEMHAEPAHAEPARGEVRAEPGHEMHPVDPEHHVAPGHEVGPGARPEPMNHPPEKAEHGPVETRGEPHGGPAMGGADGRDRVAPHDESVNRAPIITHPAARPAPRPAPEHKKEH
jgi:hypothetical protein